MASKHLERKSLFNLAFMQKAQQSKIDEVNDRLVVTDEKWYRDIEIPPPQKERFIKTECVSEYIGPVLGRYSCGGVNPEIEAMEKKFNEDQLRIQQEEEEQEKTKDTIDDEEMADRYMSLVGSLGKKLKTKRERNASSEQGDDADNSAKKRKFMKPS